MIFASVGTQKPFDRMMGTLDEWAGHHPDVPVVAQVGPSAHTFKAIEAHDKIEPTRFAAYQAEAELLVSHAGMGAILSASALQKPLIIMPRKLELGEHRNDHQMATAQRFSDRTGIHVAWDESVLADLLERRAEIAGTGMAPSSVSTELLATIQSFITHGRAR